MPTKVDLTRRRRTFKSTSQEWCQFRLSRIIRIIVPHYSHYSTPFRRKIDFLSPAAGLAEAKKDPPP
jgi:hypothetical protein